MPWSEWITPDLTGGPNPLVKYSHTTSVSVVEGADLTSDVAAAYALASTGDGDIFQTAVYDRGVTRTTGVRAVITSPTSVAGAGSATVNMQQVAYWYAKPDDALIAGQRDWFPDLLLGLTEGVDYAGRPDRSPDDDDYYVEYQSGIDAEFAGWLALAGITWFQDVPSTTASGRIAFATNPPPTETPPPFDSVFSAMPQIEPQSGPAILSVSGGASGSTDFSASLEGLTSFGIVSLPDALPPNDAEWAMNFPEWQVSAMVQLPPFRYWIPGGDTWLRNHQRDDGLGSNAPRNHRVSSVQRSVRNHGYR
jgi:hypothetical protein